MAELSPDNVKSYGEKVRGSIKEGDACVNAADRDMQSSDDKTITAGIHYTTAKEEVRRLGLSWPSALALMSTVGERRANECIRIAADPDPGSAASKAREANVAANKAMRKRLADEKNAEKAAAYKTMATKAEPIVSVSRDADTIRPTAIVTREPDPPAPVDLIVYFHDRIVNELRMVQMKELIERLAVTYKELLVLVGPTVVKQGAPMSKPTPREETFENSVPPPSGTPAYVEWQKKLYARRAADKKARDEAAFIADSEF